MHTVKWHLCSSALPFDLVGILASVMLAPPLSDIPTKGRVNNTVALQGSCH